MKKEYSKSLFIFRTDLRLEDNTALINALQSSEYIIPCFIIDPRQVESKYNEYKSKRQKINFVPGVAHLFEEKNIVRSSKIYRRLVRETFIMIYNYIICFKKIKNKHNTEETDITSSILMLKYTLFLIHLWAG